MIILCDGPALQVRFADLACWSGAVVCPACCCSRQRTAGPDGVREPGPIRVSMGLPHFRGRFVGLRTTAWQRRSACRLRRSWVSGSQIRIDWAVGSNSRASSSRSRPARTRSTIWRQNSGVHGARVLGIRSTSGKSFRVSTKSGQSQAWNARAPAVPSWLACRQATPRLVEPRNRGGAPGWRCPGHVDDHGAAVAPASGATSSTDDCLSRPAAGSSSSHPAAGG